MKEVTYEDWVKNSTPRMMWVWDDDEKEKVKRKVIYLLENKDTSVPVIALSYDGTITANFKHCAEIEKTRRMTNQELAWWLSEKPHRELKIDTYVYKDYYYKENEQDAEVADLFLIREDDSEWREPFVEETE